MVMRRSMEIFALLQEQHKQKEKEAEEGVKKLTREWEEQGLYGVKVTDWYVRIRVRMRVRVSVRMRVRVKVGVGVRVRFSIV
jgi:hypothetical protein